ncbi:bacillithiol biosynthesis deacetylase BshB1 [Paraflavitalea sp. CAU 1676]|uniref:bacillithiol biosynthesis deacetylase BshB1 n=1 Tax=Paraflavitalea sp. CAU 1676 TaxID=3032598 RepID=UPI0023DCD5F9|nr:bacillithiol biosynthesis deacetylase BshB1 [Paraflavitalea sp. CAU 1676]MDF2191805.1 bacillithiol biosynthesis deacetylase BshB1 [Paraflavitalea sp. CAU 1676]
MKLDILAIGVHPDDVELGCSGTLLNEIRVGKKVGILDLTQGELGTRGTIETRYAEAAVAAQILGVQVRENLKMRDGFFRNDEEHQLQLIRAIRKYQPEIVIANILDDRHPDHGRAGHLIADACFLSGLVKIETKDEQGNPQARWRPKYVLHYMQDWFHEPDILIDISDVFEQRMKSIEAYSTQFFNGGPDNKEPQTYISSPDFLDSVIARARMLGKRIGVKYAEGFISEKKIGIRNLDALVQVET